jgi:hypothetical protein
MEEHLLKDLESQEVSHNNFFEYEREERHKDDLACIGIMLIFIFIHIIVQAFEI